jgi:Smg protein
MFDILVYLFENYYQAQAYPDFDTLERKLHAAGFENDDIHDALDWLNSLTLRQDEGISESLDARSSSSRFSKAPRFSLRCCASSSSSGP